MTLSLLRRRGISQRIFGLIALSSLGMVAIAGYILLDIHHQLSTQRQDELTRLVEAAKSVVAGYHAQAEAGTLSAEEAKARAAAAVGSMRYAGKEYFFVQDADATVIMHPSPKLVGKSMTNVKDAAGKYFSRELSAVAVENGHGFVDYMWPKANEETPSPKLTYVELFEPWGWVIGTGLYVDDLEAAFWAKATVIGGIALAVIAAISVFSVLIARGVIVPLRGMTACMTRIAQGDLDAEIPARDRGDEVGAMAQAMAHFREAAVEQKRLEGEKSELERRAEEEKREATRRLADDFEAQVGSVVDAVSSSSTELQSTAETMASTAEQSNRQAAAVAAASEEATSNVQTVASAAEEMAASISEIGRQVGTSTEVAQRAVDQAAQTNSTVEGLSEAAQKVGEIVGLISDIAEQTNLLALNATIEAARAGEAGKGFAVVAGEVKSLASQTAKATDEISAQIGSIQGVAGDAVKAIQSIEATIGEISEIAGSIASAVEEQGATTNEIARNVQEAAHATHEVADNIGQVSAASSETGAAAGQVLGAASELSRHGESLREQVGEFLRKVRAA